MEKVHRAITDHAVDLARSKSTPKNTPYPGTSAFYSNEGPASYFKGNCHSCGKIGHKSADCTLNANPSRTAANFKREKLYKNGQTNTNLNINANFKPKQGGKANWAFSVDRTTKNATNKWFKDSGATGHFTHNKDLLENFVEREDKLFMGNGISADIKGIGRLRVKTHQGNIVTFEEVQFVPDLKVNLFSTIQTDKKGLSEQVTNGKTEFVFNDEICFTATRNENCWIMDWDVVTPSKKNSALLTIDRNTWHERFCHIGDSTLEKLKSMVDGLKFPNIPKEHGVCATCATANAKRRHFGTSFTKRSNKPLKMVHMDWNVVNVVGNCKEKYALIITDEHSGCRFPFMTLNRDGETVVEVFDAWRIWAERMVKDEAKVMCVRTDNAKEFKVGVFRDYLRKHRIDFETSIPYEHEQNGTAEASNRALFEKGRAILLDSKLDKQFWPEAIRTAAYSANRSPSPDGSKSCWEMFTGVRPNVEGMRVFGSVCWAKVPVEHTKGRMKLEPRAVEGRMVGYAQGGKSYRILLRTGEIILATNVNFDEKAMKTAPNRRNNQTAYKHEERRMHFDEEMEEDGSDESEHELTSVETPMKEDRMLEAQRPRRSTRIPQPVKEFWKVDKHRNAVHFAFLTVTQALSGPEADQWREAIEKEEKNFVDYKAFGPLIELPPGKKAIPSRMLLTVKHNGTKKARGVVGGHKMEPGIEILHSTYAPVPKPQTMRMIIIIAAMLKWAINQADVRAAYLNATVKEEIYVKQFPGREDPTAAKHLVRRMLKSVYGTPQAGANWQEVATKFLIQYGFKRNKWDPCLFEIGVGDKRLWVLLWVDDTLTVHHQSMTTPYDDFMKAFGERFQIEDLGEAKRYVGIDIIHNADCIRLEQQGALEDAAIYYQLANSKSRTTPMDTKKILYKATEDEKLTEHPYRGIVGCLMHPMVWTRPDLAYAVSSLGQFLAYSTEDHWEAATGVMKYANSTKNLGLVYEKSETWDIIGYCDSDWAGDLQTG